MRKVVMEGGMGFPEVQTMLSQQWKTLTEEARSPYEEAANSRRSGAAEVWKYPTFQ